MAQVVSEAIFDVARLVEAARHQRFDPLLGRGSTERSDARVPPGTEFDVRRQAGVDEALGVGDGPLVEPGDPGRERLYVRVEFGIGQGAIRRLRNRLIVPSAFSRFVSVLCCRHLVFGLELISAYHLPT